MTTEDQEEILVDLGETLVDLEKCTKQSVLNVRKNAKYLSNQHKANQFFVETVSLRNQKHLEDTNLGK